MFKPIDLSIFPKEREVKLKEIKRYVFFDVLQYRSDLWTHTHRVLWVLEALIPLAQKYIQFDLEKARALALVHDDAEMVTGDIQAITKARMTPEELAAMEKEEEKAVAKLIETFPKQFHGYSYEELLLAAARKDSIEAQLVSYADKLDAWCETMHEIYSGNISLLRSFGFYINTLSLFPYKYPKLAEFLKSKESPLTYFMDQVSPNHVDVHKYMHFKPYTEETLMEERNYPAYNAWRDIVLEKGGELGRNYLLEQKEFLPQ